MFIARIILIKSDIVFVRSKNLKIIFISFVNDLYIYIHIYVTISCTDAKCYRYCLYANDLDLHFEVRLCKYNSCTPHSRKMDTIVTGEDYEKLFDHECYVTDSYDDANPLMQGIVDFFMNGYHEAFAVIKKSKPY